MKRTITKPNGDGYMTVEVDDTMLKIVLLQYDPDLTIQMDKKVVPQLIEFLQEYMNECTTRQD